MLEEAISAQLRQVFGALESKLTLVVARELPREAAELLELARAVAATSEKIDVVGRGRVRARRADDLTRTVRPRACRSAAFLAGHEFTSLMLALLNADGKGKLPDSGVQARVRAIKGPVALRTFVSLSCTNCPDVVQALNLVTLLHPRATHEMVDGELFQDEVERLGLQGVPAVFAGDELMHVGKGSFAELVEVLETKLGRARRGQWRPSRRRFVTTTWSWWAVGPRALRLRSTAHARACKTAIVAQKFGGQVMDTLGIENLIGTVYTEGPRLSAELEKHVRSYTDRSARAPTGWSASSMAPKRSS